MTRLSFDQLVNLKMLLNVEGIGPGKIRNLLTVLKTTENILHSSYNSLLKVDGIHKNLASRIQKAHSNINEMRCRTERELNILEKINAEIITVWDAEYPDILKKIYDPPILLYCKGKISETDKYSIGIVGTRNPSNYGKIQAERFAAGISSHNIAITSGLARGIDTVSHRAVLKSKGRTIAVVGSGLDVIYPPENKGLFDEIAESGLILSEFEPGSKPDAQNFPRRNRIISGLSLGILVIETKQTGGAMITASFALDQNREVFAVPGNIGSLQSEGTNLLIQKGEAKLVVNPDDLIQELGIKLKPLIGKNIPKPDVSLNMFEEKIVQNLGPEPIQIDKIAELSSMSTSDCLVYLLSLEFKGVVKQFPGKMFALL